MDNYDNYNPENNQFNQQPPQPVWESQPPKQEYGENMYYQQQPVYAVPIPPQEPQLTGVAKAFSIVSLACGIASLCTCWAGIFFGIAALVFSNLTNKKSNGIPDKRSRIGQILGIIGTICGTLFWIAYITIFIVSIYTASHY